MSYSCTAQYDTVRYMWLFTFNLLNKIKSKCQFISDTSHILNGQ